MLKVRDLKGGTFADNNLANSMTMYIGSVITL